MTARANDGRGAARVGLSQFLPDGNLSQADAARSVPKALAIWQYCYGYASLKSTTAKFAAHPEWRRQ